VFAWPPPVAPWHARSKESLEQWIAEAIAIACCLGETLSRPMLEAIAVVATCPIAEGCARQILRDEHLHATFGWETLTWLVPRLGHEGRNALRRRIGQAFAGLQRTTACGISVEEVAGKELEITRGPPNLGTLTNEQYAMIFYATVEQEIIPALDALGLDGRAAWSRRD
jgi:hypothetical protein